MVLVQERHETAHPVWNNAQEAKPDMKRESDDTNMVKVEDDAMFVTSKRANIFPTARDEVIVLG